MQETKTCDGCFKERIPPKELSYYVYDCNHMYICLDCMDKIDPDGHYPRRKTAEDWENNTYFVDEGDVSMGFTYPHAR